MPGIGVSGHVHRTRMGLGFLAGGEEGLSKPIYTVLVQLGLGLGWPDDRLLNFFLVFLGPR